MLLINWISVLVSWFLVLLTVYESSRSLIDCKLCYSSGKRKVSPSYESSDELCSCQLAQKISHSTGRKVDH